MTTFGDAAAFPPQDNYYQLVGGDMAASAAAAALAHQALSEAMAAELTQLGANTSATAVLGWQGAGGAAMTLSAGQLMDVFAMAIAWLQEGSLAATQIVEAHQTAAQTMVPGPVCDQNRIDYAALAATNWIGQNFPPMAALDAAYFGEHWPHNASVMAGYQAVVSTAVAVLGTPPPLSPSAADPAGALAGVAQAAAQAGGQGALQSSAQAMTDTAQAPVAAGQAVGGPASAAGGMSSAMAMPIQMISQGAQAISQLPQTLSQAPQMLGQLVALPMGLMGPLSGGLGGLTGGIDPAAASPSQASPAAGTTGGGGGPGMPGGAPVASAFTRPVSSFTPPAAPKLPGGWSATTAAPEPVPAAASGTGGGGLYGAPTAMGRNQSTDSDKTPARQLQLTGRSPATREDRQRN
jgi:PPE-repeat protein